jgi:L-ribulose-5-phosphate 3-epimerase
MEEFMKKAISIWAFPSDWPLGKCFDLAAKVGLDAVELAYAVDGPIHPKTSPSEIVKISKQAKDAGVELCSLATGIFWSINLLSQVKGIREEASQHITRMLELADLMKVDHILVVPGFIGPFESGPKVVEDYDSTWQRALDDFRMISNVAEQHNVSIGIENVWNKFLTNAYEMRAFIDAVGSPFVGSYFDVGNCLRSGYPEHWIKMLGKRIKGVHFKDFRIGVGNLSGFVDLLEGDVNYPAVMKALKEIGYDGACVAELFSRPMYPEGMIERIGLDMRSIFGY